MARPAARPCHRNGHLTGSTARVRQRGVAAPDRLGYLHDGSDLDLLWDVTGTGQAETIVAVLQHCERRSPTRLDGELRFPGDRAVNWREYASGAARLMVKGNDACSLVPREALTAWQVAA